MPQMAPMSWTILFTLFIALMMMFMLTNYYLYIPLTDENKTKEMKKNQMTWKW